MIELTTRKPPSPDENLVEIEREPLLTIDGEKVTVPVAFPPQVGLRYLDVATTQGMEVAALWLLKTCLGDGDYRRVLDTDLTAEQLNDIVLDLARRVLGAMELGKASSGS